jgi:hypothetical protein
VTPIDVHRILQALTVLIEQADNSTQRRMREFGEFRRDCRPWAFGWPSP